MLFTQFLIKLTSKLIQYIISIFGFEIAQFILLKYTEYEYGEKSYDNVIREYRPTVELDDGVLYRGEWNVHTGTKDGKGVQLWPDGSKYKGYWRENKANGRGRLIHR